MDLSTETRTDQTRLQILFSTPVEHGVRSDVIVLDAITWSGCQADPGTPLSLTISCDDPVDASAVLGITEGWAERQVVVEAWLIGDAPDEALVIRADDARFVLDTRSVSRP